MLSKKRKIELLEATLKANRVVVYSLEKKLRLMKDPQLVRNHLSLKRCLLSVNYEFQIDINNWVKMRSSLTREELEFILNSLPYTSGK